MRNILGIALVTGLATPAAAQTIWHTSYYGAELAGRKTASGERFNPSALTAAHRNLPFGTQLKLTNTRNGRSVIVRVNDRGPFVRGRMLDVSRGAAMALGFLGQGTAPVRVEPMMATAKLPDMPARPNPGTTRTAGPGEPDGIDNPAEETASGVSEPAPESETLVTLADRALRN